jgi:hypothetical protein
MEREKAGHGPETHLELSKGQRAEGGTLPEGIREGKTCKMYANRIRFKE